MADTRSFQIRRATSADVEKVLQIMRRSFYRDEPLNVAVGLMNDVETCPELEHFCLEKLNNGMYTVDGREVASSHWEVFINCGVSCAHETN
jgi:hypothetical protein